MEDSEGAVIGLALRLSLEIEGDEGAIADFLFDGPPRDDGDAGVDLDRPLDGLDVVEFHDRLDGEAVIAEDPVDGAAGGDVGFEGDEFLPGNLGDGDFAAIRQRMLGAADRHQAVAAEGLDLDQAAGGGEGDEAEVAGAGQDVVVDLVGAAVFDVDVDAGMALEEALQVGGQLVEADAVDGGDADRSGDQVAALGDAVPEGIELLDDAEGGLVEKGSLGGEGEVLPAAVDEGDPEAALEGAELLADGGLGDAVGAGGLAEAAAVGQVAEDFEGFYLHPEGKHKKLRCPVNEAGPTTLPSPFPMSFLSEHLPAVQARIDAATQRSGRPSGAVSLIAVTKTHPPETVLEAVAAGLERIGENKVQEARAKQEETGHRGEWHLLGHLQSNKVKYVPPLFDWVHSIDSLEIAQALSAQAREAGRHLKVLLQVNPSGEKTKFGVPPELAAAAAEAINGLPSLELRGLMMLAPYYEEVERTRPHFAALRETRDRLEKETGLILPELSMGMSSDFEVAIEEGSTMIRLGTILFGPRPKAAKVRGDED